LLDNFLREEMHDKDFKKIKREISAVIINEFKKYSDNTKEFWEKANNAEKLAKEVPIEIKRINQKLNNVITYSVFFFMVCIILVFMIVDF